MTVSSEIKIFTKNTLIVTLFFALSLELSWDYVAPMLGIQTQASSNDANFQQAENNYLGTTATALSIAIWQKSNPNATNIGLAPDVITIEEVLRNPINWQRRLIGTHMQMIQTYVHILETDIRKLLDESRDRTQALDEHISLLKSYGTRTNDNLIILDEQISDLKAIIEKNTTDTANAKWILQWSLSSLDYNGVDNAIENYTKSKNSDTHARIYLIYLERFRDSYQKLQTKNKNILTVLTENRDALIKKSVVVVSDGGTDLIKELWIIQNEAEYKANQNLKE